MTGYEACLILHGKKKSVFLKVALNNSTHLNFMAVFYVMRYGSKPGKLENSVGESGFFYKHDSKVGQFPYIFLNRQTVFYSYARGIMETYWKVSDVAAAIQVSVQTVYRYVANGEIPFHNLNKAVRFKPSEIENWMESRKAGVTMNQNGNIGGEGE